MVKLTWKATEKLTQSVRRDILQEENPHALSMPLPVNPALTGRAYLAGMGRHRMRWEGVLGTFLEVQVETPFPFLASRVFRAVLVEVERLEGVFSRHRESELTRLLERGQGTLSPELAHLLALGVRLMEANGGAFTLSPGFVGVPLELKGKRALVHAPLDLDGFAKGYIADRALERAWEPGVAALLVNLGGIWPTGAGGRFGWGWRGHTTTPRRFSPCGFPRGGG